MARKCLILSVALQMTTVRVDGAMEDIHTAATGHVDPKLQTIRIAGGCLTVTVASAANVLAANVAEK